MSVELREPRGWQEWRLLRLEALADTPIGFGERLSQAQALTDADWDLRWTRPGIKLLAYVDGAGPVGMAGGFRHEDGRAVLFGVYVTRDHRGRGVLEALVDRVQAWCDPDPLFLDVHIDNARARRAYMRLGFVETGGVMAGAGIDGRDLLDMVRSPRAL